MYSTQKLALLKYFVAIAAAFIFLAPPLAYLALQYQYERAVISVEADINGRLISELINANPELWTFEQLRLEEILAQRSRMNPRPEDRAVFDLDDKLVARNADALDTPRITAESVLFDAGTPAGRVEVSRSMRGSLVTTAWIAMLSLLLAIAVYVMTHYLPLRALHKAFTDLRQEREKALVTLQSIGDAVITTDAAMQVEYLNPIAETLTGWTTAKARGHHMDTVFKIFNEKTGEAAVNPIRECLATNAIVEMENHTVLVREADQARFHIEDSAAPIRKEDGSIIGAVMVFHDVTERRSAQNRLRHIAFHDDLTGLPNRALFQESLLRGMQDARDSGQRLAVLFMDLDRFKTINDSLGHAIGDELLILVGQRLQRCVRETDIVSRMGGDEFTAVLKDLDRAESAGLVAANIIEALSAPFQIHGQDLRISASIGITLYPDDGDHVDVLLKNADTAMYHAKDKGRNNFQYYSASMSAEAMALMQLEAGLSTALENDEYVLEYQPKLDLESEQVIGAEALLRWNSPKLGRVMPADFVPLLEESGAICDVGHWVLRSAIMQAKRWMEAGLPMTVSVNVSVRQFQQDSLVDDIMALLASVRLPVRLLQLEVTESILMEDADRNESIIRRLTDAGVRVALDDFGTGYSSLSYLRRFPISELKIDRSFVLDMVKNSTARKVIKTIIQLGQALDMTIVAEGVESEPQKILLRDMGCDALQGFLLSRPLSPEEFEEWLASRRMDRRPLA